MKVKVYDIKYEDEEYITSELPREMEFDMKKDLKGNMSLHLEEKIKEKTGMNLFSCRIKCE